MKHFRYSILCLFAALGVLTAQEQAPPANETASPEAVSPELPSEQVAALKEVMGPLEETKEVIEDLDRKLHEEQGEEARRALETQIEAERARLRELRQNFSDTIGRAEAAEYEGGIPEDMSLQKMFAELVEPVHRTLQDLSASPRELDALRDRLDVWQEKLRKCEVILERIDRLRSVNDDPSLSEEFDLTQRLWERRKAGCQGKIGVLKAQIYERESQQRPFFEALSDAISKFFRTKGLNLILAVFTGVLMFYLARRIYAWTRKYSPMHRRKATFSSRLFDVGAGLMAVLIALWSAMLIFYVRGDWLLLTLVVLFLIGAVWAGKASLPQHFEQVRTLLNLGSIREGERVIYEGLPFRVKALGFLTILDNPRLEGGEYRIPVKKVMHMISRQPEDKEPWFPTETNDWVVMADGTYGKVITQTPEQVVILKLGGSMKTYPSADFLAGIPENLSHGFRVACTFGIDYMHQKISTSEVPEIFEKALQLAIHEKFDADDIRSVQVEFKEAGSSSLDMQINVDVSGNLGSRYQVLERMVQRVCVNVCNEQGWVIPFTQITVHQASDASPSDS